MGVVYRRLLIENWPSESKSVTATVSKKCLEQRTCACNPNKNGGFEMTERFQYMKVAPGAYRAMAGLEHYLHESGLEESLLHLVKLRASQING